MRQLRITLIFAASLLIPVVLALAGCGEDNDGRFHGERDRSPERYEQHDNDRHDDRRDNDRHDDRDKDSGRARGDHDDR